jgi:acetyl/propionyl-CoA carboxylase alpha subunit
MAREAWVLRFNDLEAKATWTSQNSGSTQVRLDDGEPFTVRCLDSRTYRVAWEGHSCAAKAVFDGSRCWIHINGQILVIDVQAQVPGGRSKQNRQHPVLTAPMPAKVIKVLASEGQKVRKGDTLVLLESMKMELSIKAPMEGTVRKINCKQGDLVAPETQLIEFE